MPIITRENIRLPLHTSLPWEESSTGQAQTIHKTHDGTLVWDTDNHKLELIDPSTQEVLLLLSGRSGRLESNEIRLLDVRPQNHVEGIDPKMCGALSALHTQGVIRNHFRDTDLSASSTIVELIPDLGAAAQAAVQRTASVTLFKDSGKYYTIESWKVPVNAIGPYDMTMSPDFRRISGGAVLVDADSATEFSSAENWGFPHLFPSESV